MKKKKEEFIIFAALMLIWLCMTIKLAIEREYVFLQTLFLFFAPIIPGMVTLALAWCIYFTACVITDKSLKKAWEESNPVCLIKDVLRKKY